MQRPRVRISLKSRILAEFFHDNSFSYGHPKRLEVNGVFVNKEKGLSAFQAITVSSAAICVGIMIINSI